jgi:hypothetical protein
MVGRRRGRREQFFRRRRGRELWFLGLVGVGETLRRGWRE